MVNYLLCILGFCVFFVPSNSLARDLKKGDRIDYLPQKLDGRFSVASGVEIQFPEISMRIHSIERVAVLKLKAFDRLLARGVETYWYEISKEENKGKVVSPSLNKFIIKRDPLYYKGLFSEDNSTSVQCVTELFSKIYEGDTFRLPDNTQWKIDRIDNELNSVSIEVISVPKSNDPGLVESNNNTLTIPMNSTVTLNTNRFFARSTPPAFMVKIFLLSPKYTGSNTSKMFINASSSMKKHQRLIIPKTEYQDIKVGQKIELIPGQLYQIKKIVNPDPGKKIRGWIEFDTTRLK